jgi:hypothetical protein
MLKVVILRVAVTKTPLFVNLLVVLLWLLWIGLSLCVLGGVKSARSIVILIVTLSRILMKLVEYFVTSLNWCWLKSLWQVTVMLDRLWWLLNHLLLLHYELSEYLELLKVHICKRCKRLRLCQVGVVVLNTLVLNWQGWKTVLCFVYDLVRCG